MEYVDGNALQVNIIRLRKSLEELALFATCRKRRARGVRRFVWRNEYLRHFYKKKAYTAGED